MEVVVHVDAETAVADLLSQFAIAMESHDIDAMRQLYPAMPAAMASGYEDDFFPIAENLRVTLLPGSITQGDGVARATFSGTFVFDNAAGGGRETTTEVEGEGRFELGPSGWSIVELSFEN